MDEPDLSWRLHWRLIVVAAILAIACWGGLIYWQGLPGNVRIHGEVPAPVVVVPSATPAPVPPPHFNTLSPGVLPTPT